MKIIDPNNQIQKEALLNEYKGNLFEYLVAYNLSQKYSIESIFFMNLNESLKERLVLYEEFIRMHFYDLLLKLQLLAKQTVDEFDLFLKKKNFIPQEVFLIGKNVATNDNDLWGETDIVIKGQLNGSLSQLKISLKLSKDASYTNTKSAGVKSFFEKYFKEFSSSSIDQNEFNRKVDFYFQNFGAKLYTHEGLSFNGSFDEQWTNHFPSLPGELNDEQQKILFEYYAVKAELLYHFLLKYYQEDRKLFKKCLLPLVGQNIDDLVQVITFHKDHFYKNIKVIDANKEEIVVDDIHYKLGSHYIDIKLSNKILQLRIKPMNKFTTQSYKVNCSVKDL